MYLSRVQLDTTCSNTILALSRPQRLHGAVESAFEGERRRRLWRLDRLDGKLYLLLLSEEKPNLSFLLNQFCRSNKAFQAETRDYTPLLRRIEPGGIWQFRLVANPTISRKTKNGVSDSEAQKSEQALQQMKKYPFRSSKIVAHCTVEFQKQWLEQRAEKHGFLLREDGFTVTASRWYQFVKKDVLESPVFQDCTRPHVSLLSVTYEGTLQVTDPDLFCQLLTNGIGRGKAYGLGLMTIMRPGGNHG